MEVDRERLAQLHQQYLDCGLSERNDEVEMQKVQPDCASRRRVGKGLDMTIETPELLDALNSVIGIPLILSPGAISTSPAMPKTSTT